MGFTWITAIVVALCGIGVGLVSALFGVGGGVVMIPLLHLAFGQPAAIASGTSVFAILPTTLAGMMSRKNDGTIHLKVGLALGLGGACFSPVGAWMASHLPGIYAMLLTAVFILFTSSNMFKRAWKMRPAAQQQGVQTAPASEVPASVLPVQHTRREYAKAALIGSLVGLLSGYLGVGGGFIIVPFLQAAFGFSIKEASGTSLVAMCVLSIPSFIAHALLGNIYWMIGILLVVGSILGSRIGARISARINDRLLTALFGALLLCAGVMMIAQELLG